MKDLLLAQIASMEAQLASLRVTVETFFTEAPPSPVVGCAVGVHPDDAVTDVSAMGAPRRHCRACGTVFTVGEGV